MRPGIHAFFSLRAAGTASFLDETSTTGNMHKLPSANLMPLNVKGPTCFIPSFCATKANPQIIAASSSNTLYFVFPLFNDFPR
jgi:hypothetical protein